MLFEFYKNLDAPEQLGGDILIPSHHTEALYISENGELFCYTGIYSRDAKEVSFHSWPYYLRGKNAGKCKNVIKGFLRLKTGCILITDFLDQELHSTRKFKQLKNYVVRLPTANSCYFGIEKRIETANSWYFEEDEELSRSCFGLTSQELEFIVQVYAQRLGVFNDYIQYPRVTRSMKNDNFCDITGLWIPPQFPYVTFSESGCPYSHISLNGFYHHVNVMLSMGNHTMGTKIFMHEIPSNNAIDRIQEIDDYFPSDIKITREHIVPDAYS